jgi:hypothetical protein
MKGEVLKVSNRTCESVTVVGNTLECTVPMELRDATNELEVEVRTQTEREQKRERETHIHRHRHTQKHTLPSNQTFNQHFQTRSMNFPLSPLITPS